MKTSNPFMHKPLPSIANFIDHENIILTRRQHGIQKIDLTTTFYKPYINFGG